MAQEGGYRCRRPFGRRDRVSIILFRYSPRRQEALENGDRKAIIERVLRWRSLISDCWHRTRKDPICSLLSSHSLSPEQESMVLLLHSNPLTPLLARGEAVLRILAPPVGACIESSSCTMTVWGAFSAKSLPYLLIICDLGYVVRL